MQDGNETSIDITSDRFAINISGLSEYRIRTIKLYLNGRLEIDKISEGFPGSRGCSHTITQWFKKSNLIKFKVNTIRLEIQSR